MKIHEIIMRIQVCLIWWMNIDSMENSGKKAFYAKTKHPYCVSQWGEYVYFLMMKRIEIIIRIQVCVIWQMNFDSKENGGM